MMEAPESLNVMKAERRFPWVLFFIVAIPGCELVAPRTPPTPQPFIHLKDLDRKEKEELDLVYIIHPACLTSWKGLRQADEVENQILYFQQVTWNVLSNVFRHVVKIDEEKELTMIEDNWRALVEKGKQPSWIHDPDALLVVDFRVSQDPSAVPHQLQVRLLDLKLPHTLECDYNYYETMALYNRRALVVEGFQEVASVDSRTIVTELRDAWKSLFKEVLDDPRYRKYQKFLRKPSGPSAPCVRPKDKDADWLRLYFFGEVSDDLNPGLKVDRWEQRLELVAMHQLFGKVPPELPPSPASVAPVHRESRLKATHDASKAPAEARAKPTPSSQPPLPPSPAAPEPRGKSSDSKAAEKKDPTKS